MDNRVHRRKESKYLTVSCVTNESETIFSELSNVSRPIIRRAIVSDLHYSHKRLVVKPQIAFSIDSI